MTEASVNSLLQCMADGIEHWRGFAEERGGGRGPDGGIPASTTPAIRERSQNDELAGAWGPAPVTSAHVLGVLRLVSATDHLAGVAILVPKKNAGLALDCLIRSLVETSLRALWLLDGTIDARQRVGRSMTEYLHDSWRGSQAAFGASESMVRKRLSQLTAAIDESSTQLGFEQYRPNSGRRRGQLVAVGEPRPSVFDLLARYSVPLGGDRDEEFAVSTLTILEHMNRAYSAAVHGESLSWMRGLMNQLPEHLVGPELGLADRMGSVLTAMYFHQRAASAESDLFGRSESHDYEVQMKRAFVAFLLPALQIEQRRRYAVNEAGQFLLQTEDT